MITHTRINHFQRGIDDGRAAGPGAIPTINPDEGDESTRAAYLRGFAVAQRHHEATGGYVKTQEEIETWRRESEERSRARRKRHRYELDNVVVWTGVVCIAAATAFGIYCLIAWALQLKGLMI
jgi:hypothetical protein